MIAPKHHQPPTPISHNPSRASSYTSPTLPYHSTPLSLLRLLHLVIPLDNLRIRRRRPARLAPISSTTPLAIPIRIRAYTLTRNPHMRSDILAVSLLPRLLSLAHARKRIPPPALLPMELRARRAPHRAISLLLRRRMLRPPMRYIVHRRSPVAVVSASLMVVLRYPLVLDVVRILEDDVPRVHQARQEAQAQQREVDQRVGAADAALDPYWQGITVSKGRTLVLQRRDTRCCGGRGTGGRGRGEVCTCYWGEEDGEEEEEAVCAAHGDRSARAVCRLHCVERRMRLLVAAQRGDDGTVVVRLWLWCEEERWFLVVPCLRCGWAVR